MSAYKSWTLCCDLCGDELPFSPGIDTTFEAREQARDYGWSCEDYDDLDYCDSCAPNLLNNTALQGAGGNG